MGEVELGVAFIPCLGRWEHGEEPPARAQHTVNVGERRAGVADMLKHLVRNHEIEGAVAERQRPLRDFVDAIPGLRRQRGLPPIGIVIERVDAQHVEAARQPKSHDLAGAAAKIKDARAGRRAKRDQFGDDINVIAGMQSHGIFVPENAVEGHFRVAVASLGLCRWSQRCR